MVEQIINKFTENLRDYIKKGFFSVEYITKEEYHKDSRCHSRVWGILVKTGHDLGFIVDIEKWRRYDTSKSGQPDIIYLDEIKDRVIIEYESHNAGWDNHYSKKCPRLKGFAEFHQPDVCLLIATLTTLDFTPPYREKYETPAYLYEKLKDFFTEELDNAVDTTTFCLCVLDEKGLHPKIVDKDNLDELIELDTRKIFDS